MITTTPTGDHFSFPNKLLISSVYIVPELRGTIMIGTILFSFSTNFSLTSAAKYSSSIP
jgi:hypothetical protein